MSNTNNKSLNDLLGSVQADAKGDILSQSEVERLLPSIERSVPVTQSIQQKLFERLLSTPLKIGMTAMTTAACITLGLIAFWPTSQQTENKAPILSQRTEGAFQNYATAPTSKPSFIVSQPNEAFPATAIIPSTPITTADSLQPVELAPEQLAQLGITLEDNGDIVIYKKENDKIDKFGFPPTWGMRLSIGDKISEDDTSGINILKAFPRLITEPDGAKRLFSFEQDSSFTQKNGDRVMVMHMENQTQVVPSPNSAETNNAPADSSVRMKKGGIISQISVSSTDSINSPDIEHGMASVNMDSIMKTLNIDSILAMVNIDSIVKSVKGSEHVNMDSIMREAKIAMKNAKHILSSMHFMVDTGNSANIKIEMDANSDNPADSALFSAEMKQIQVDSVVVNGTAISNFGVSKIQEINMNGGTIINDSASRVQIHAIPVKPSANGMASINFNGNMPPPPPPPPHFNIEQMENSIDLSKLIPIRVINLKNANHPNELIFWYESSPELTAAMPAAVNPVPAAQSKQLAISVYPNPTNGPATIHYELADAPRAYFSVRNLLGQEMLNGGMTSGTTGDANLDLSQLPAGVYLLVTTTDNGERDVERVVVTK